MGEASPRALQAQVVATALSVSEVNCSAISRAHDVFFTSGL